MHSLALFSDLVFLNPRLELTRQQFLYLSTAITALFTNRFSPPVANRLWCIAGQCSFVSHPSHLLIERPSVCPLIFLFYVTADRCDELLETFGQLCLVTWSNAIGLHRGLVDTMLFQAPASNTAEL
jgi:hypothetical protein